MGSGKSHVGHILSKKLRVRLYDVDKLIVKKEGCSINNIFAEKGEPYFRDLETRVIKEMQDLKETFVLSTGGGAVLKPENIKALKKIGTVIHLKTSPSVIFKRLLDNKTRPLLRVDNPEEKIKELLESRACAYHDCNFTVETDTLTPEGVSIKILELTCE